MPVCCSCSGSVSDTESLKCCVCKKVFHAMCSNLTENDLAYLKTSQNNWKCQSCVAKGRLRSHSSTSQSSGSAQTLDLPITMKHFQDLMQAISAISSDLNALKVSQSNITADIGEIKIAQNALQTKFDSINETLELHSNSLSKHKDLIEENATKIQNLTSFCDTVDSRIAVLSEDLNKFAKSSDPTSGNSAVSTSEILERMKRSHNVIIRGIAPSGDGDVDCGLLARCVDSVARDSSRFIVDTTSLGADSWKLGFSNPQVVTKILRNKKILVGHRDFRRVRISDDITPLQRSQLKSLRDELRTRQERGEMDITIKYIRGEPTIVKTPSSSNGQKN